MPTNRTRRARKKEAFMLDVAMRDFLLTGDEPQKDALAWELWRGVLFDDAQDELARLWRKHKGELLAVWKAQQRRGIPWICRELRVG